MGADGRSAADGVTPRIRPEQLEEMRTHLDDIDFAAAARHEKKLRHDVMAHIHTFAEAAPSAADIIHLGPTSCYVTDNTDLILMREGLQLLRDRLVGVIGRLARFAKQWRDLPAPEQVDEFLAREVEPLRGKGEKFMEMTAEVGV